MKPRSVPRTSPSSGAAKLSAPSGRSAGQVITPSYVLVLGTRLCCREKRTRFFSRKLQSQGDSVSCMRSDGGCSSDYRQRQRGKSGDSTLVCDLLLDQCPPDKHFNRVRIVGWEISTFRPSLVILTCSALNAVTLNNQSHLLSICLAPTHAAYKMILPVVSSFSKKGIRFFCL